MDAIKARSADAFKISLEAGEVVVEFGQIVEPGSAASAAGVAVADRVILPLDIARRLAYGLNDCLKPHKAAILAEEAKVLPPSQAALVARPGQAPVRAPLNEAGERAAQLLRLVGDLGVPYQYERSFRMCDRALLANRFLLTLDADNIPGNALARTLEICDKLRIPGSARESAEANFATAKCIHFGFESDDEAIVCKLYLERAVPPPEVQRARRDGQPALLHLALKWDPIKGTAVTTRYFWRPAFSAAEMEDRLAHVYRDGPHASLELAKAVLDLTKGRVATEQLQYLEVEEAENARRSFDLNLYNARLRVSDMQHLLLHRMREHFNVRPGRLQALYDQIKDKALGHLAGGVHRDGEDFFNIYYGVVGLPHFNRQLR
jgi:tryptophan halogenase